jgi:putative NADPH-quinone reductase
VKTIHIISANPHIDSLSHELALAYASSAKDAGYTVSLTHIITLKFDYNLQPSSKLEPDLLAEQKSIKHADHIVIVTPLWWNAYPACLKAYFDRIIVPGFAFNYPHPNRLLRLFIPKRHLKGTSARIINTQDSPTLFTLALGAPMSIGMRFAVLWFSGVWPVRRTRFSRVRKADNTKRQKWLKKVTKLGVKGK